MSNTFDAILVADGRFAGGSTAALVADAISMVALGMRVGLIFVRSAYLNDARDRMNPKALALADLRGITRLDPQVAARGKLVFLHHPLVFFRGIEERLQLNAERAVIVTHHAPFRADGSLEWDPVATRWRARHLTGLTPWFAPISGVVRAQLASFAPLIRQTSADWPNVFNPGDWQQTRPILAGGKLIIGRHGRPDALKFPATGAEIDASLPASDSVRVRVLGCPVEALAEKGAHPGRWDVLPFGAEPVADFLNSLDIFSYHYHPNWLESFGRTVIEAILCGRPCVLDPRLETTFGDMATYCKPEETAACLARTASDVEVTREKVRQARETALQRYGADAMQARIEALARDAGVARREQVSDHPLRVMRKLGGLYRRRAGGATG